MDELENRTIDEIEIGDQALLKRRLSEKDIKLFAAITGEMNPAHLDADYARSSIFGDVMRCGYCVF